jgi:hypothetical protein
MPQLRMAWDQERIRLRAMNDDSASEFPISPLGAKSVAVHEVFKGFVEAGFTREEALQLTQAIMIEQMRQAGG